MAYEDGFEIRQEGDQWHVMSPLGVPVGARFDLYSGEIKVPLKVAQNPFPKILGGGLAAPKVKMTEKQALAALLALRKHIRTVREEIKQSLRIGASQFW